MHRSLLLLALLAGHAAAQAAPDDPARWLPLPIEGWERYDYPAGEAGGFAPAAQADYFAADGTDGFSLSVFVRSPLHADMAGEAMAAAEEVIEIGGVRFAWREGVLTGAPTGDVLLEATGADRGIAVAHLERLDLGALAADGS